VTKWNSRFPTIGAAAVLAWCTVFAAETSAACFAAEVKGPFIATKAQLGGHAWPIAPGQGESLTHDSVVGMWHTVFRIGDANGPVYDETFQQFHIDGTEIIISNGLPPALGNVCIGVWKQVGLRTFKLRHVTWNWAAADGGFGVPGSFAGSFEMVVKLKVDRRGTSYSGTWAARNFDASGNHIPDLDAEGVVRATRITVD